MQIVIVVAMDQDGFIGREGALPWHLPADLRHFRAVTWGKPVIMGRRTWESLKKPLSGRRNIVLTRRPGYRAKGAEVAGTPQEALDLAGAVPEVVVAGGAGVYAAFLPRASRLHLTLVEARLGGDVRFPPWKEEEWRLISREDHPADDANPHPYSFRLFERPPGGGGR